MDDFIESEVIGKILSILEPEPGDAVYPHLQEIYLDRLPEMREPLSRCCHLKKVWRINGGYVEVRSDDVIYQYSVEPRPMDSEYMTYAQVVMNSICRDLERRFEFYGLLGEGSYGVVFAARRRDFSNGVSTDGFKHYAVKVVSHQTLLHCNVKHRKPMMGLWEDRELCESHYVPEEAVVMLFLRDSDRFPTIDSVYTEDAFTAIVMSSALDGDPRMNAESATQYDTKYKVYCGHDMLHEKKTLLNEMEVCKVASQILEAMVYLRDMGLSHDDLSHFNYIIGENLDVQLIDVGLVRIGRTDSEWEIKYWHTNPYQEYLLTPELAIELTKDSWRRPENQDQQLEPYLPHDQRAADQWKFACITFELLHGYAPWEKPEWQPEIGGIRERVRIRGEDELSIECQLIAMSNVWSRRHRMINRELTIDENLSQDCVDVLRTMLARDPAQRPDPRATMQELSSFPWFQGQWIHHGPFRRPTPFDEGSW